jgi:hypothetical protein
MALKQACRTGLLRVVDLAGCALGRIEAIKERHQPIP